MEAACLAALTRFGKERSSRELLAASQGWMHVPVEGTWAGPAASPPPVFAGSELGCACLPKVLVSSDARKRRAGQLGRDVIGQGPAQVEFPVPVALVDRPRPVLQAGPRGAGLSQGLGPTKGCPQDAPQAGSLPPL